MGEKQGKKMGRPTKLTPNLKKQMDIIDCPKSAKEITCPVIYGIADKNSLEIVYIGKTINVFSRYDAYKYRGHNPALKDWLKTNQWVLVIIEKNPENLNDAEKKWIAKYKPQLFNMVGGGDQHWRHHDRKPWMAGQNIKCPSDILLTWLRNRNAKGYDKTNLTVSSARVNMTDSERAAFEVGIAMQFYNFAGGAVRPFIENWLSFTESRLLLSLEGK